MRDSVLEAQNKIIIKIVKSWEISIYVRESECAMHEERQQERLTF